MTPADAVSISFELFSKLTGAPVGKIYHRNRGADTDTARNLAGFLLYEVIGPTQPEGWLTAISDAAGRDYTTVRACALKYDWRRGTITQGRSGQTTTTQVCPSKLIPDLERLWDFLDANWRDALTLQRAAIAKARTRFRERLAYWRKRRRTRKLQPEDIFRAVAALGRALPKVERTSVPVIADEPLPMRILRQAPISQAVRELSVEPAYGGGHYISAIIDGAGKKMRDAANDVLQDIVRMFDGARFRAKQSAFSEIVGGFKGVLHVAAASILIGFSPLFAAQERDSIHATAA